MCRNKLKYLNVNNVNALPSYSSSKYNCSLNSFNCYYTNAQSVYHKFEELSDIVTERKPLVVGITETWLKSDIKDAEINLQGYDLFRSDRKTGIGGGSCLYLNESLKSSACAELDSYGLDEAVWRKVKLNEKDNLLIGVIYRSTSSDTENNEKLLQTFEAMVKLNDITHYLIMGDFNFPEIKWNDMYVQGDRDSYPNKFYDGVNDVFLHQHVQENTRCRIDQEPSLLDLIFTNEESMVDNLEFNAPLGKSDHVSILWTFYSYTDVKTGENLSDKRSWYKADFKAINEQFASVEWERKF